MMQKPMSGDGGSGPPSSGIGLLACDLQRSVNILMCRLMPPPMTLTYVHAMLPFFVIEVSIY